MSGFRGRRVLVTGGQGFIASHLIEAVLSLGAEVAVVGRGPGEQADGGRAGTRVTHGPPVLDPTFKSFVREWRPGLIYHLAGHASIQSSFQDPRRDLEDNVGTTLALLEAVREMGDSASLIHVSSAAVYGSGSSQPLREDAPTEARTPYGVSKLCSEGYVTVYARSHGLRAATARLFPLFGPGQRRHVIFDLLTKLTRDPSRLEVTGDGLQTRDLLYISDCVGALKLLAERATFAGEVYNVSGNTVVTIRQLVQAICEHLSVAPEITYTGSFRAGGADDWVADTSRIGALGYEPQVDLWEGLRRTVSWFRSHAAPQINDHS